MAVKMSKKTKASAAKKNAEAMKAKKKATRVTKGVTGTSKPGAKGKSAIGQSKKK